MITSIPICTECGTPAQPLDWRCTNCEGALDLANLPPFDPSKIHENDFSLWRYREMLPVKKQFTLGEGMTPLAPTTIDGFTFQAKLEYLNPTGSYKDRGTTTMMNHIAQFDVPEVIDNSSGNAGASVAAFSSVSGINARIFVPAKTAVESKKALIRAFGGTIVECEDYENEIYEAAKTTTYASHAWSPYFVLGQTTVGWETWEQLGKRAPDAIATPVGHGGLFLGFYRGFKALHTAGLIDKMPKMIAVQSTGVDPIIRAWESGADSPPEISPGPSVADGILVKVPVRGKQILEAIRETDGCAFRVDNDAILAAQKRITSQGIIIEPTSAVTVAALPQIREKLGDDIELVIAFTGNGLKNIGMQL